MKIKKTLFTLTFLTISAFASAAGVTPAQIDFARDGGTLDQVWITSPPALGMAIYKGWTKGCQANTSSIFYSSQANSDVLKAPGSLGEFVAYACIRGTRTSVLYHTMDSSSLSPFSPFTIGTTLSRLSYLGNTSNTASCNKTTGYVNSNEPIYNADMYKDCARTGSMVVLDASGVQTIPNKQSNAMGLALDSLAPQQIVGGFSDVEPTMFSEAIGGGNVSSLGTISEAYQGQAFGVVVSIPLYRKLQEIQGISEQSTEYNYQLAPSLTKGQIASIFAEGGTLQAAESWLPILRVEEGEKVIIHRRQDTTGTQAASNAFFLGNPCVGNSRLFPSNTTSGKYEVKLNYRASDVKNLITLASNSAAGSRYAIGVLSLADGDWRGEKTSYAGYRFIKVDGVHPETDDTIFARKAAASGAFPFHMELKTFVSKDAPSGFQKSIIGSITNAMRNQTSTLACMNWPRGLTFNPDTSGSICSYGEIRAKFTNFGDNCKPTMLFE